MEEDSRKMGGEGSVCTWGSNSLPTRMEMFRYLVLGRAETQDRGRHVESHFSNPTPSALKTLSTESMRLYNPLPKSTGSPGVASGQPGFLANLVNAELLWAIASCYSR
jgi:hypothetical protein